MMTAQLAFLAEIFGTAALVRRPQRPEDRSGRRRGPLAEAIARWRRQHAPPVDGLSDHLRRDIGLAPLPRDRGWLWHR